MISCMETAAVEAVAATVAATIQTARKRVILPNQHKSLLIIANENGKDNSSYTHHCHHSWGWGWCWCKRNQKSRPTTRQKWPIQTSLKHSWLSLRQFLVIGVLFLVIHCEHMQYVNANRLYDVTTPLQRNTENLKISTEFSTQQETTTPTPASEHYGFWQHNTTTKHYNNDNDVEIDDDDDDDNDGKTREIFKKTKNANNYAGDSIFMRFAKRFSTGNELWDGIIRDCYQKPSFVCFQSNVYTYLKSALETGDVNITQRLKLYKNNFNYMESNDDEEEIEEMSSTQSAIEGRDEHVLNNEIPHNMGRAASAPESPIEEITTSLYGKSIKFAMTHDIEVQLPEMLFDGATFRISPRGFEGNGIIAKLELIPKQEIQARLAGKIIMNKIKKFLRSKVLLSFLALLLIIKIIKIKLFWLLPLVIGVGAAKKLLLKFLLFLFPALSHLFKLCSYYQQTYHHSTKYHHHLHHIDHHHTIVPPWHGESHHPAPEIIYTSPPKGHISAYLHGAPIHETYGPPGFEHNEGNWENSGPGLGPEYINDVHRAAQVEENSNYFKPHTHNDANEILAWGLGTTQQQQQLQRQKPQYTPHTQQPRPPSLQQQQQQLFQKNKQQISAQTQQKPHTTSQIFNPFASDVDKQSIFSSKYKMPLQAQSAPRPVYTPTRNAGSVAGLGSLGGNSVQHVPQQASIAIGAAPATGLNAAQIVAQYEPTRNPPVQKQEHISPEVAAQLKEALRIQAEQRIIAQQQKILENQPFVQDGQPLMPKNYDPFYSPLLLKIDKIVEQLGVKDELCKERLICSMYKDPARYSPHSNFVSAELSRDTSELQPVTSTNPAVVRFYRLIQAARDGQDQRDCLSLYPQCNINTE